MMLSGAGLSCTAFAKSTCPPRIDPIAPTTFWNMPSVTAKRILVVDDEPFVCESIKMLLAYDGHEVLTASGGTEALTRFDPEKIQIVFTDFAMPGMKGD